MIAPLHLTLDVACPSDHAFAVWTSGIATWWPPDHTVSGGPELVVMEPGVGGRLYERTPDGVEHDWGHVTAWDPPTRLVYLWHIGRDRSAATEVEVRFVATGADTTRVDIEHRGWEQLGQDAEMWRDRNGTNWASLLPHFAAGIEKGDQ